MSVFDQCQSHATVYAQTEPIKKIPTLTFRPSTYKRIFTALTAYDTACTSRQSLPEFAALSELERAITNWLTKPAHQTDFANPSSQSARLKPTFDALLAQTTTALATKLKDPGVALVLGEAEAKQLAAELASGYTPTANPLLVHLLKRLVTVYQPNSFTASNFQGELVKYVTPANDIRGNTSVLVQALGHSGGITFSVDFGKLILPFLKLSLDLAGKGVVTVNKVLLFETLATDYSENEEDLRYGMFDMIGRSKQIEAEVGVTAGVGVSTAPGDDVSVELEIASINVLPSFDPPSAEASAEANVSVKGTWTVLHAATAIPEFLHSLTTDETVTRVMNAITSDVPKKVTVDNAASEAVIYIVSNAYGASAGVSGKASAQAFGQGIEVGASATLQGDFRKSTITYQSPTKSLGGRRKTQITDLFFKQVVAQAQAQATGTVADQTLGSPSAEKSYDFVNSMSYQSIVGSWDFDRSQYVSGAELAFSVERTGRTRGQSLQGSSLKTRLAGLPATADEQTTFFSVLAKQLGIGAGRVQAFFVKNYEAILDIVTNLEQEVTLGRLPATVLNALFLEASFALKTSVASTARFTLDENTWFPDASFKDVLDDVDNLYLESIRFRVPRTDQDREERPGFKFGLNLGIVSFGIDLGVLEDASSLALDDLVIDWFDPGGAESSAQPEGVVPATALIF